MYNPLPLSFYRRSNVLAVAKELLGKTLFTHMNGILTGGIILETEGYAGMSDRASHAYGGRRTARTEVMYQKGGIAYVYFCYGMHYLLNAVTGKEEEPHAVLIRALQPTHGIEAMLQRRKKKRLDATLTSGPGALCQALGIDLSCNALPLDQEPLWIEEGRFVQEGEIAVGPRVGVAYAEEDAHLPYRFQILAKQTSIL